MGFFKLHLNMNNKETISRGLFGNKLFGVSQILDTIQSRNSDFITSRSGRSVLPVIGYPQSNKDTSVKDVKTSEIISNQWKADKNKSIEEQFFPLGFQFIDEKNIRLWGGEIWYFPIEVHINISGSFNLTKQSVNYNQTSTEHYYGTVKTRVFQNDYKVTITGLLIGENEMGRYEDTYPIEDLTRLKAFLTSDREFRCHCDFLNISDIFYLSIESFSFPFTKGENMQAFTFEALSDQVIGDDEGNQLIVL